MTSQKEIYAEVLTESIDCQKALRRCRPAEKLSLDLVPDDQAEKKVIRVSRQSGESVGYLEQDVCDKIALELEASSEVEAMVLMVTDGGLSPKHPSPGKLFSRCPRHCYIKITA